MADRKIGRDAESGHFKSVAAASKDKEGSVVETIKTPSSKKPTTASAPKSKK